MLKKQQGLSLIQGLLYLFVAMFVFFTVFKVVPAYAHNYSVQAILDSLQNNRALQQELITGNPIDAITSVLMNQFDNNNIREIKEEQITVVAIAGGNRVTVDYDVKVPLFGNISLLIHFNDSADINLSNE